MRFFSFPLAALSAFLAAFLLAAACGPGKNTQNSWSNPSIGREDPKQSDPAKQEICSGKGRKNCKGSKDCEEICGDIFFHRTDKRSCYELSEDLVMDFHKLLENVKKSDIENLNLSALECLLDIDERGFSHAVRKMSRRSAEDFLISVSENKELARILAEEDDEGNILKQLLFKIAKSSSLKKALSKEISGGKNIIWLFAASGEQAYNWLDIYVSNECDRGNSDCLNFDSLGAYCDTLMGLSKNELKGFLSETDVFSEKYEDTVERAGYEYDARNEDYTWNKEFNGDFRDFCNVEPKLTEGERDFRSKSTQRKYFSEDDCKEILRPAHGDEAAAWADAMRISDPSSPDYLSNRYVWGYGNIYGSSQNSYGAERLKAVGNYFWHLNERREIINRRLFTEFGIFIKRGLVAAPKSSPRNPKERKVKRAAFIFYTMEADDPDFPGCDREEGDMKTCLYSYCLVDYGLNDDNTVKTCDVIKCALGRPKGK